MTSFKIDLGTVFVDEDGRMWVYIGYKEAKKGKQGDQHTFECARHHRKGLPYGSFTFNAVKEETIVKKFPQSRGQLNYG